MFTKSALLGRNLTYYWRAHVAVLGGVAVAVAVLAGALLVGDSVRGSLRDLLLHRLGNTHAVVTSAGFFREKLADSFSPSCPLIALEGQVTATGNGRRAGGVQIYGVDERFWRFHRRDGRSDVGLTAALARELGHRDGDAVLVRVEKYSAIPLESLHGRKEDAGRTLRVNARILSDPLGQFSLRPQQGEVRAVFVPLRRLQRDLKQEGKVNTILLGAGVTARLQDVVTLDDLGIKVRVLEKQGVLSLEKASTLIDDTLARTAQEAAAELGWKASSYFTYLVNTIRVRERAIPYSLVTAREAEGFELNEWAARELGARPGDRAEMEFYVWKEGGALAVEKARFPITGIAPMSAADRDLAPEYPGITESPHLSDWDPPFPIDLKRVRPQDEKYWDQFRTTPKAFLPLAEGQRLWSSRFGNRTSIRLRPGSGTNLAEAREAYVSRLRRRLDPARLGLAVYPVRAQGLEASRGATDFGEYFVYFSFFLVASAVLLAGLFFKLGVEQRGREIGVLRTLGFPAVTIRGIFLKEGLLLAVLGSLLGLAGAVVYGRLVIAGLGTWWVGAVGTSLLTLHVTPQSLALGFAGGVLTSGLVIAWTLRGLQAATPRGLVSGPQEARPVARIGWLVAGSAVAGTAGLLLLAAAAAARISLSAGFFGAGSLLLLALLGLIRLALVRNAAGVRSVAGLGFRNATYRPGRSTLCIALIASATFILVSVDAFRRRPAASNEMRSGHGGFPLMAEALVPLVHDPNSAAGRESLNLTALPEVRFVPFRLRPGDDASCLNLYEPRNPRILGASSEFLRSGRFAFQESLPPAANPWKLLEAEGDAIPAAVDANSLTYVLHRKLGEEFVIDAGGAHPIRLRLVAALEDSIFQGELIIAEKHFLKLFPEQQGYRFFLLDVPVGQAAAATTALEEALADYGFDVSGTEERLAQFHRVENTYLSTFQTLGGLGLLLGTLGLGAILLRNVYEQRRELALLRAVGYRPGHLALIVLSENIFLLGGGLLSGTIAALVAIAPALGARGAHPPILSWTLLLPAVLLAGLAASLLAVTAVVRWPILPVLRSE